MAGAIATERLITSAAARRAGVSEQSIRQWARSGLLPVEQTPLGILVDRVDLDTLLLAREQRLHERSRQLGRVSE
jgi:predicted site-specific integrase-resolvase